MTPPNAPTAAERCALRHPGMDVQRGLPKGHRGSHTTEIPGTMPWATHGDGEKTVTPAVDDRGLEQWFRDLEDDNWGDAVEAFRSALLAARRENETLRELIRAALPENMPSYGEWAERAREALGGAP